MPNLFSSPPSGYEYTMIDDRADRDSVTVLGDDDPDHDEGMLSRKHSFDASKGSRRNSVDASTDTDQDKLDATVINLSSPTHGNELTERGKLSHWICFFILGVLNNFHYVIVLAAASSVAESFGELNLIGVIAWATVMLGLIAKLVNALLLVGTSFNARMLSISLICCAGMFALAVTTDRTINHSFIACIAAISVIGSFSAIGESIVLGYLKHFAPRMTGAWSSGTGLSGIAGTSLYVIMASVGHLSDTVVFYVIAPTALIYYLAFLYIQRTTPEHNPPEEREVSESCVVVDHVATAAEPVTISHIEHESKWHKYLRLSRHTMSYSLNLTLVYFFEYVIIVGFGSTANCHAIKEIENELGKDPHLSPSDKRFYIINSYEILSMCYQIGVLISRSSVECVRIKAVWVLTLLQALNFMVWFLQCWHPFANIYLQFVAMGFVGLMGGFSYVNIFYSLRRDKRITDIDREIAINVVATSYYLGIIASSIFDIILSRFIFPS